MDALEIMSNLDNVFPYFQPIFNADEHKIIGYEVLGRYAEANNIKSLGSFFLDDEVPEEYQLEVDDIILRKALAIYVNSQEHVKLFVNRKAGLLMEDDGEHFLNILREFEEDGLQMDNIVLEIPESDYSKDLEHLLRYYKTLGICLAIDHIGETNGNIHKFAGCSPDILKVSLQSMRSDIANQSFNDVIYSISMLSRKIGASLLFESIELEYQLQYAWKHGGRYYQGFYLQEPSGTFHSPEILKATLRKKCQDFISHEKLSLERVYLLAENIQNKLQAVVGKSPKSSGTKEEMLREIATHFEHMCFRLYICDENGFEMTSNYFKKDGDWIFQPEYRDKNWSWRPYFLENILKMQKNRKGLISDLYSDIETGELTRTFSYPINENEYLFLDISYEFLYEQEGLLY